MCTYCTRGCQLCNARGHVPGGLIPPCPGCRDKHVVKEGVDPYPPDTDLNSALTKAGKSGGIHA